MREPGKERIFAENERGCVRKEWLPVTIKHFNTLNITKMTLRKNIAALLLLLMVGAGTPCALAGENADVRAQAEMTVQPVIKVHNGVVEIMLSGNENRQVYVYSLTGQLVKSVNAQPGTTTIELPAGYYIVKCDRLSQRVIVR